MKETLRTEAQDWWRLNPKKNATYDIEWNRKTGYVRARVNNGKIRTIWEKEKAHDIRHAEFLGLRIISKILQKHTG